MKRGKIKVGAKGKSARPQMELEYNRPENVADCVAICKGDEQAVAALCNRGLTIWLQDRFGRPMFEAGAQAAEIQKTFDTATPGVSKGLGRPKAVPTVVLKKGMSQKDMLAAVKAAGIVIVEE